jgi:hypothetical protein
MLGKACRMDGGEEEHVIARKDIGRETTRKTKM